MAILDIEARELRKLAAIAIPLLLAAAGGGGVWTESGRPADLQEAEVENSAWERAFERMSANYERALSDKREDLTIWRENAMACQDVLENLDLAPGG